MLLKSKGTEGRFKPCTPRKKRPTRCRFPDPARVVRTTRFQHMMVEECATVRLMRSASSSRFDTYAAARDTDLALVELNVNDGTSRAFERVHRKILARESGTALLEVLVEDWAEKQPGEEAVVPRDNWKSRLEVLDYYKVPYVSQAGRFIVPLHCLKQQFAC